MKNVILTLTLCLPILSFASTVSAVENEAGAYAVACAECHGVAGEGRADPKSPALAGLPDYYVLQQLEKFRRGLRGMEDPEKKARNMHAMAETMDERTARAVASEIAALDPVASPLTVTGDRARGEVIYGKVCAECHGLAAEGNAVKESPPLHGFQDWYLVQQIEKLQRNERKADPSNLDSIQMHAVAVTELKRPETLRAVVAFIASRLTGERDAEP